MNLTSLSYFVQVATEGNLTRVADKLFISQPTLSRHIKELETELGRKLFIRQSHTLKLSKDGQIFLPEAVKVLEAADKLTHIFDSSPTVTSPVEYIRIGYLENFDLQKMYATLSAYKQINQHIEMIFTPDNPTNLTKGLEAGTYDLIFSLLPYVNRKAQFKKIAFIENHLQIALPANHPLSKYSVLSFDKLANETFILLDRDKSPIIVDYVLNKGLENGFNLTANYYVKSLGQGLSMTALGNGLSFLYSAMNPGDLASKYNIKIADLTDVDEAQDIYLAINTQNKSATVKQLFKYLRQVAVKE